MAVFGIFVETATLDLQVHILTGIDSRHVTVPPSCCIACAIDYIEILKSLKIKFCIRSTDQQFTGPQKTITKQKHRWTKAKIKGTKSHQCCNSRPETDYLVAQALSGQAQLVWSREKCASLNERKHLPRLSKLCFSFYAAVASSHRILFCFKCHSNFELS